MLLYDYGVKIDLDGLIDFTFVYDIKRSDILETLDPRSSYFHLMVGRAFSYSYVCMKTQGNVSKAYTIANLTNYCFVDRITRFCFKTKFDSINYRAYSYLGASGNKDQGNSRLIETNYHHRYLYFLYAEHCLTADLNNWKIVSKVIATVHAILLNWHGQDLPREGCKSVPKLLSEDRLKLSLGTFKRLATMIDTGQKIYVDKNLHT